MFFIDSLGFGVSGLLYMNWMALQLLKIEKNWVSEFGCMSVRMKKMEDVATEVAKKAAATPPPPPPPLPKFTWVKTTSTASVTNQEIAKFWRQKRMEEEEHFLAAIRAAARIRAQKLTKDEYEQFMESLEEDEDMRANDPGNARPGKTEENNKELRVGIKDWWTKSKYAYLNQPAIEATNTVKLPTSSYVPYNFHYKPPTPPPSIAFGIF